MLNGLEEQFILEDVELFQEFDVTNFVSNTKATFGNKLERIDVPIKINHYINMIDKAIKSLENVEVDKSISNKINSLGKGILIDASDIGGFVKDITFEEFTFKDPSALTFFAKEVQNDINKIVTDKMEADVVKYRINTITLEEFKHRAVSSNNTGSPNIDVRRWKPEFKFEEFNGNYVMKKLLPFVSNFNNKKAALLSIAAVIKQDINNSARIIKTSLDAIERLKREGSIAPDKVTFINMAIYNVTRTMLEAMSFITFAIIRKINILVNYSIEATTISMRLLDYNHNLTENAFDDTILPLDTQSLADEFINGEAGAFMDVANNIYQFHMGNINNMVPDENITNPLNFEVSQEEYDSKLYTDINEIFTQVGAGLDKIGAKTDDLFMVSDDIVDAAGFDVKLYDRFANTINNIDDASMYQGTANLAEFGPTDKIMFKRILAEIHDFGDNLSEMAKNCAITKRKIVMLQDRFNDNVNGEFTNVDTVMDLKIFLDDILEQYEDIVRSIVKKYILRLKRLGDILSEVAIGGDETKQDFTIDDSDSTVNYAEMAFDSILDDIEEVNESTFNSLNTLFYYAMESYLTGYDMVLEDGEGTPNTTPTVQDNSAPAPNTATQGTNAVQGIAGKITEFLNQIIDKFTQLVDKQGKKNIRWLAENKEELTRRSYNNVTVNILPYENIKPEKIIKDIQTLENNLNGLQITQLSSINNESDVYRVLFSFIEGGVDADHAPKDQIEKYYKVGRGDLTPKPIANGQLKTTVVSTMIPYCENYYGQFKNQLSDELKKLGAAADSAISKMKTSNQQTASGNNHPDTSNSTNTNNNTATTAQTTTQAVPVTASAKDLVNMIDGFLMTEADNPQQGGTNSHVATWISKAVKRYSGCVLNACRDRANDYMKVLDILVPKTTNSVNRSGSSIETTTGQQTQAAQAVPVANQATPVQ